MKICILSRARTRSSIFCSSIQKHYQCRNFGELYFYDKKLLEHTPENFKQNLTNTTEKIFSYNDFVIKIWPRYSVYSKDNSAPTDLSKLYIISDLENTFLFSQYDKIYYVTRNIVDSVCSYYFALYRQQWMFSNNDQIVVARNKQLSFNFFGAQRWLNFYLYETLLQDHMLQYLQNKNLLLQVIDYEDIPNYCNEKYYDTNKADVRLDSQLDYKTIFTNYSDIEEYVMNFLSNNKISQSPFF